MSHNIWYDNDTPELLNYVTHGRYTSRMHTRSLGGGFVPFLNEYWCVWWCSCSRSQDRPCMLASRTRTHAHTHACTHARIRARKHASTQARTFTHTHAQTRTRTQTQRHTPSPSYTHTFRFPRWPGSNVYRYSYSEAYITTFSCGVSSVRHIWGDDETEHYYASGGNFVYKKAWPSNSDAWSYNLGTTVGGASKYLDSVYAMKSTGRGVVVLRASDGQYVRTFQLSAAGGDNFGNLLSGLVAVGGKLYRGDTERNTIYRWVK